MNSILTDPAMGAANNRVAILDAGAQYGKVSFAYSIGFILHRIDFNTVSVGH